MGNSWKDSINSQCDALNRILLEPLEQIAADCIPLWEQHESLENLFLISFSRIPYCTCLFALSTDGRQVSASVSFKGIVDGTYGRDRSQSPYIKKLVPAWGFLLSEAYINQQDQPAITALQIVRSGKKVLGFIAADFDLRCLPITSEVYIESAKWPPSPYESSPTTQTGHTVSTRSQMDKTLNTSLLTLENLITERGVFQCQIHFSGNLATIWKLNDPYNYQLLDNKMLTDRAALDDYPMHQYPQDAEIPRSAISDIFENIRKLRQGNELIYLHSASINLFNGKIGLGFSSNLIYFPHYDDFLIKKSGFWFSNAKTETSTGMRN